MDEGYYSGSTLGQLRLTWYNNIQPARMVEIVNWMREMTLADEQVFYPIYTDAEIAADPGKADTGTHGLDGLLFVHRPGEGETRDHRTGVLQQGENRGRESSQVPPEKEKAIEEALRHFQMIP